MFAWPIARTESHPGNGGTSYVIGNLIEQGTNSQNSTIVTYLEEGVNSLNPGMDLYVINNSIVNDLTAGTFIFIGTADTVPAVIKNNIFVGPGTLTNQTGATLANNFFGNPLFVNQANFDYHLTAGPPAIDAGTSPGSANGFPSHRFSIMFTRPAVRPVA